jgi:hypothetical protein
MNKKTAFFAIQKLQKGTELERVSNCISAWLVVSNF